MRAPIRAVATGMKNHWKTQQHGGGNGREGPLTGSETQGEKRRPQERQRLNLESICLLKVTMLYLVELGNKSDRELMCLVFDMLILNAGRISRWRCPVGSWKCFGYRFSRLLHGNDG